MSEIPEIFYISQSKESYFKRPEGEVLYVGEENHQECEEVEKEQTSRHHTSLLTSAGVLEVFDAEIMINHIETRNQ